MSFVHFGTLKEEKKKKIFIKYHQFPLCDVIVWTINLESAFIKDWFIIQH